MSTRQHVAPKSGGGWGVWRSGASRATRIFPTRRDAVAFARRLAKKESGEMYRVRLVYRLNMPFELGSLLVAGRGVESEADRAVTASPGRRPRAGCYTPKYEPCRGD